MFTAEPSSEINIDADHASGSMCRLAPDPTPYDCTPAELLPTIIAMDNFDTDVTIKKFETTHARAKVATS